MGGSGLPLHLCVDCPHTATGMLAELVMWSVRFFSSSCCECALPAMGQLFVFDGESVFLVKPHVSFSMYSDFTYLQEWSSREFYQPSLRNTEGF